MINAIQKSLNQSDAYKKQKQYKMKKICETGVSFEFSRMRLKHHWHKNINETHDDIIPLTHCMNFLRNYL